MVLSTLQFGYTVHERVIPVKFTQNTRNFSTFPADEAKELYKIRIMHVQAVAIGNTTQLLFGKKGIYRVGKQGTNKYAFKM